MVVLSDKIQELMEKKQRLLEEQEQLIELLKTKHKEAYVWLVNNNIDVHDLKKYSVSLAAAMVVGLAATQPAKESPTPPVPVPQEVRIIEVQELQGLDEDKKAALVAERYGFVIDQVSKKYGLDSKLIFSTVMVESGGNTYAIRHEPTIGDASYGLGQILYGTARGIGFEGTANDLYDPKVNIDLIGKYHRRNLDVYGNLTNEQLITAYNAGSPYNAPLPGHLNKFQKWYKRAENLDI